MPETPQQYVTRLTGYLGAQNPLEVMDATPGRLAALLEGRPPAALARTPAPGKWSVREILAHLADTEIVLSYRVRRILETDGIAIQAYDQDRWAALGRYAQIPVEASLARLAAMRPGNVTLLRSLTAAQLAQTGLHAERGPESIGQIMRLWAGHDRNHQQQIEAILARG